MRVKCMSKGKKIYFSLLLLTTFLVSTVYFSYAFFTSKNEEHGKLNIVAGTLNYKIESDDLQNNSLLITANTRRSINVKITSLNDISSKYELYYNLSDNSNDIEVGYSSNTKDAAKGIIDAGDSKIVSVIIENNTNNNVSITFDVHGGLSNFAYDDISNIGFGLNEIITGDVILAWSYVGNNITPTSFPKKGQGYKVKSVECNEVDASFDNASWQLSVPNISSEEIVCNFVFDDVTTLYDKIINDNVLVTSKPTLTTTWDSAGDEAGLYRSYDTNNFEPTYYFRGSVTNNYLNFAELKWRIVRINEDGTIRIIKDSGIGQKYNFSTRIYSYKEMYYSNSDIFKPTIEAWYTSNLGSFDSYIATSMYCEESRASYNDGYSSENVNMTIYTDYIPTFKCNTDDNGYGVLNQKIGLLTYDEAVYAGGYRAVQSNHYLKSYYFRTMSPAGYNGDGAVWTVNIDGSLGALHPHYDSEILPVINLNYDTVVTGSGTSTDPYVVK